MILDFTLRHGTNHIEEKRERGNTTILTNHEYWQNKGYYINLSGATDKMWQHEGGREERRERKKYGRRKNIIYFQLTIRNQDFEEIRMFY